ncbi:sensor histidine kinase [Winogradskyella sp. F6397]|uniref:histidine kinase n=1 Tax=Winogradskyella marina TaxID=2785530 RepID=A0ABS0EEC1_9FLAO|nr:MULTISPECIES: ATP-binding protein [Winogradskyella]MBF8148810.1 sensor histidine kinase [Winogradskyella marina]
MQNNSLKKSYKFALRTGLYVTLFTTFLVGGFLHLYAKVSWHLLLYSLVCFPICFGIIQYRVERYIYRRVKKIYDDLTLLESTSLRRQPITTDMGTLTKEIDKYAKNNKFEIETLKIREEYRKEFIGNVSHELKTPLFTVQSYLLTLLDGGVEDEKIKKKYLTRATKGVERLTYIIKDLDMITKLEVGDLRLEKESFDMVKVVQNVFDLFEMKSAKKNITLTFDIDYPEPIMVYADKERIQQVLTNLVVNSIKYGREKGTTEVSIENLIKNKAIIRVTDNGEGIAKANLQRLFERFYRVDKSGSRKEGGSGLGLSIVKHIIEAHEEKIYIESELGVGSEFSFTLEKSK